MLFAELPRDDSQVAEGVVHLPNWLAVEQQRAVVDEFRETARQVAGTPLAMR